MIRHYLTILILMSQPKTNQENTSPPPESIYFQERMQLLGISDEENKVGILQNENGQNVIKDVPVFTPGKKQPGIDIQIYTLDRSLVYYKPDSSRWTDSYRLTRLANPIAGKDGKQQKYMIPKGQGTYPFFHPSLIDKFEKKEKIETLFITEGFFKAWKGCKHGLDVIGVSSITHLKEKDSGLLHVDIRRLRDICGVKKMVWLTDGDCLDITTKDLKDGVDLYKRPKNFYQSCENFKTLLDDWEGDKWFFHIDTDSIINNAQVAPEPGKKITRDQVKGLDDLLITFSHKIDDIVSDARTGINQEQGWFSKHNITIGTRKIFSYFHLINVNDFYLFHRQRVPEIANLEFIFNGTRYKYSEKESECKVVVPAAAKDYFRVGDNYYKFIDKVDEEGRINRGFEKRQKETIKDDHGKRFIEHIPKYECFSNVPSHTDYQQVIHNTFNMYYPFAHDPEPNQCDEDDCKYTIAFLKHIFGEKLIDIKQRDGSVIRTAYYQLALDYIQLLYQKPTQRLPILCLVSKENETGKSTFGDLLKAIFTDNAATVGNSDLADDFNSFWASKLLIMCDETKIDKQSVVEKVKSLTFAKKIGLNAKGRDKIEISFFGKFMFFTNNEENFIYASDEDLRYWVIKVPRLREKNPDMIKLMLDEIPFFLAFLNQRKLVTPRTTRMWFEPDLLRTEALKRVIEWSQSTVKKELKHHLRQMFLDFGVDIIEMTLGDIRDNFFKNKESNYIERVLKDEMGMLPFHNFKVGDRQFDTEDEAIGFAKGAHNLQTDFEALRFVKKNFKPKRYKYPKTEKHVDPLTKKTKTVHIWVNADPGRVYQFHKKDYLLDDEESEGSPELIATDDAVPATNGAMAQVELPIDDLPF
jgi:hypothetical protein